MLASSMRWTAEMVRALPDDGRRHEVVDGEYFVNPSPRPVHQMVVMQLYHVIEPFVRAHRLGVVGILDSDLSPDPFTLVQPDLWVAPNLSARTFRQWEQVTRLSLAIEVLSPSSVRADREVKRARYQRWEVPMYWIVDADARCIDVWTPFGQSPTHTTEQLLWQPDSALQPLAINLPTLFADALGD